MRKIRGSGDDRSNIKKLWRKGDARSTGIDEARRYGSAGDGIGIKGRAGARRRGAAVRQRRAAAGEIPAEAADDRPDQPAAAAGNAVLGLQRGRDNTEQRVLRALSPRRRTARYRSGKI